jgi:pimeloyl-ACP methyl ester carboxylesterase
VIPALAGGTAPDLPRPARLRLERGAAGRYELSELAGDMVALLDELGLEQVDLIGHDWGGYAGFLLCLGAPERIRRYLALGVVHPWFEPPRPSPKMVQRTLYQFVLATPGLGTGVLRRLPGFVKLVLRRGAHPTMRWSEEELDCYAQSFCRRDHALASSHVYRSFLTRELPRLKKGHYRSQRSSVPTRLLFGEADPMIRSDLVAGYEPYADEMSVEEVKDCGHFVAEERPELVVERARELFGPVAGSS